MGLGSKASWALWKTSGYLHKLMARHFWTNFLRHIVNVISKLLSSQRLHHLHKLILPVQSQNVTKNRTDHRMHVEGPQICQINRWNNSFQNMYGMNRQQLTVWPGKSILCKKTPQKWLFLCARIWVTWLWKDLGAKPLTLGQLQRCPWKLWGITLQTSYVEGRWHQNWAHTSPLHCFSVCARKFAKKWFFGQNALYPNASKSQTFFVGLLNIVNPSTTRQFQKELEL